MKLKVIYSKEAKALKQPIFARAIISTGIEVNVLNAEIDREKNVMLVDVPDDEIKKFTEFLKNYEVKVIPVKESVILNRDICIDCGACVSICPVSAFYMEDFSVELDEAKCILCKACIPVCPVHALKMDNL